MDLFLKTCARKSWDVLGFWAHVGLGSLFALRAQTSQLLHHMGASLYTMVFPKNSVTKKTVLWHIVLKQNSQIAFCLLFLIFLFL